MGWQEWKAYAVDTLFGGWRTMFQQKSRMVMGLLALTLAIATISIIVSLHTHHRSNHHGTDDKVVLVPREKIVVINGRSFIPVSLVA